MSETATIAFLDRFEDGKAILLLGDDQRRTIILPAELMPSEAREGSYLVISIRFDPELTAKSREEVERSIQKLRRGHGATPPDGDDA